MLTYIVRRLLGAVVLLFVVSMVTFAIFFLVPRLAGATPETLATRYVGRAATAETVTLTAEKLGFNDPISVQYWPLRQGHLRRRRVRLRRRRRALPGARASATPSSPSSRSGPSCSTGCR